MNEVPLILKSELDQSVNTVDPRGFETRYVEREEGDTAIIYLSSHAGCDRACRMCWLTQTGQTDMTPATLDDFVLQATQSLTAMEERRKVSGLGMPAVLHYNFMARGEPLKNPLIRENFDSLAVALIKVARELIPGFLGEIKFKISTIMSDIYIKDKDGCYIGGLSEMPFHQYKPEIYYSLYSMNPQFRKRWLPKAEEPLDALRMLAAYRGIGGEVRIHGAFILGHNDDMEDIAKMVQMARMYGIRQFNIVRFNSPDPEKYVEPDEEYLLGIKAFMESKGMTVQMVARVGADVHASCGTFISPAQE